MEQCKYCSSVPPLTSTSRHLHTILWVAKPIRYAFTSGPAQGLGLIFIILQHLNCNAAGYWSWPDKFCAGYSRRFDVVLSSLTKVMQATNSDQLLVQLPPVLVPCRNVSCDAAMVGICNVADVYVQVFLQKEQLSLDVIKQCRVKCPAAVDKQKVLKEMIFPNCERLGQTIVFVTTRQNAHTLHRVVRAISMSPFRHHRAVGDGLPGCNAMLPVGWLFVCYIVVCT